MKKIISTMNATVHTLATCSICQEQGGSSIDARDARDWLFKHMRKTGHKNGQMEVGRVSQYELQEV